MKTDKSLILRSGFSLLEILVAISIIAIVFLSILQSFTP
ncbi:MAG: prepilin-type N-terminal cleavage/methylation domain-containing protein [Deltaproteobacteria bacterium]|nr:prepilin-type N-terminal cleavage/methylation domain-containing protein [Deltaproteobacteria bacterium]